MLMELERKSSCYRTLWMALVLILLLTTISACTTQNVTQEIKEQIQPDQKEEQENTTSNKTAQEKSPSETKQKEQQKEDRQEEQADNAPIINIPRFFQRRESARVTHISDAFINMSYRENNRQVQFKVVNLEQDDGVRKRTVKYCFVKDSMFFKKRDILMYHISTEVCNTHGKPYIALPIKIERER